MQLCKSYALSIIHDNVVMQIKHVLVGRTYYVIQFLDCALTCPYRRLPT